METISVIGNITNIPSAIKQSIHLTGGLNLKPKTRVVIKPNICNANNPENMVLTDFRVIKAVTEHVKQQGNEVIMVETDNISGTAEKRAKKSGFLNLCHQLDVEFLNLTHDTYTEHHIADTTLHIPTTIMEADYIINLPKMKTCGHTHITLSIKNLFGLLQRPEKNKLHKHLNKILPYLAKTIPNDLIIVDGITCMEGNGPVIGNPLQLNLLVAGKNCVSVDSVCARIMGYQPESIPHIRLSQEYGPIALGEIDVVGDDWVSLCTEFSPPFSLRATLKSWRAVRDIYFSPD